jgi:hypothetical protein
MTALSILAAAGMLASQTTPSITLHRVFTPGEKLTYNVRSVLLTDNRDANFDTFMPGREEYLYGFTTQVEKLKVDGICDMLYKRTLMTYVEGESATADEKRTKFPKSDYSLRLTVSPINELINMVDLGPKDPPKKKEAPKKDPADDDLMVMASTSFMQPVIDLRQFTAPIYGIALMLGNMDSSLDFAPKLPDDEVKVGDTWKRTVGFSPQKLANDKRGTMAVQRLDVTYTYKGLQTVDAKKFHRIEANVSLNTDLAAYINQLLGAKPEDTQLQKAPMTLKQVITYDLDPKTFHTVRAEAVSEGETSLYLTVLKNQAAQETKFRARATLDLVKSEIVRTPSAATTKPKRKR